MVAFEAKANSESKPKWVKYINPVNWIKGIARFFVNSWRFIRDSYNETRRITWPDKTRIIRSTTVVLVSVVALTGFIWVADSVFNLGLTSFLNLLK